MVSNRPPDDRGREGESRRPYQQQTGAASSFETPGGRLGEQVKRSGGRIGERIRETGQNIARDQKRRACEELESISEVVHETADRLHERDDHLVADYVDALADQIENAADFIREHTLHDLIDQASEFARRRPEVVIGGALVIGVALGRFLKASKKHDSFRSQQQFGRTQGSPFGGTQGVRSPGGGYETRTSEAGPITTPGPVVGTTTPEQYTGRAQDRPSGFDRPRDMPRTLSDEDARASGLHRQGPTRDVEREPWEESPGGRAAEPHARHEPRRTEDER